MFIIHCWEETMLRCGTCRCWGLKQQMCGALWCWGGGLAVLTVRGSERVFQEWRSLQANWNWERAANFWPLFFSHSVQDQVFTLCSLFPIVKRNWMCATNEQILPHLNRVKGPHSPPVRSSHRVFWVKGETKCSKFSFPLSALQHNSFIRVLEFTNMNMKWSGEIWIYQPTLGQQKNKHFQFPIPSIFLFLLFGYIWCYFWLLWLIFDDWVTTES